LFGQNGKLYLTWKTKAGTEGFALEQITHIYTNNSSNNSNNSKKQPNGINSSSSSGSSSTTACPTEEPQAQSSIAGSCEQQQQQQRYKLTMCVSHSARQVECYVNTQQECECWYSMLTALVNKEKGELKLKVPLLELPKAEPQQQQTTTMNNTNALCTGGASSCSSANGGATTVPEWSYSGIQ
jgi:hypothetical protein